VRFDVAKRNRSEGRIVVGRRGPVETLGALGISVTRYRGNLPIDSVFGGG
jgi:hypothetical protein